MDSLTKSFRLDIPAGWAQLLVRAVEVAVVAFIIMQAKEWLDAGQFDTLGAGTDALLIAGGVLVVNAILMWLYPGHKQLTRRMA